MFCEILVTNSSAWSLSFNKWNFYWFSRSQTIYETCLALIVEVLVPFTPKFPEISELRLGSLKFISALTSTANTGYSYELLSVYEWNDLIVWVFDMKFSPFSQNWVFIFLEQSETLKENKTWLYLTVSGG